VRIDHPTLGAAYEQWGPHAKVIEPTELAATVIDELERARALYSAR
jgi:predicted DNA-binding transcriptional regulator YafY